MRKTNLALGLVWSTLAAAGCGASTSGGAVDAEVVAPDAAAPAVDAEVDASAASPDAAPPIPDAEVVLPPDAAVVPSPDAAVVVPPDAAVVPPPDAAIPPPDAAVGPPTDATVVPPPDAAVVVPADAAVVPPPDAATPPAADAEVEPPPPDPVVALAACDADPLLVGLVTDDEGWGHVPAGTDVVYTHNPPASGPHYALWARSGDYAEPIDRRNWVHNLEHGWLVLAYRPDAPPEAIATLHQIYLDGFPDPACVNGIKRIVVTPDPLLPTPVAALTAFRILSGDTLDPAVVARMFELCRAGAPEPLACGDGQVP